MQKVLRLVFFTVYFFCLTISSNSTSAHDRFSTDDSEELTLHEKEIVASVKSVMLASTQGPKKIKLIDQGYIDLPTGYIFVPETEGRSYMSVLGNQCGPEFIGLVMPLENPLEWFIIIDFIKTGYVRDDDAKNLRSEDLIKVIKKNTEKENKERVARGIEPLNVIGWFQPLVYNTKVHHLTWSLLSYEGLKIENLTKNVNHTKIVLGREGLFRLRLVATGEDIENTKDVLNSLGAITFASGKAYADFCASTDHVAEYGLAALVVGIAAKKMGLFAGAGIFLAKIWYLLALIGGIILVKSKTAIKAFFKNRKNRMS